MVEGDHPRTTVYRKPRSAIDFVARFRDQIPPLDVLPVAGERRRTVLDRETDWCLECNQE